MEHSTEVPSEIVRKWQEIVDLLAELIHVPSALIMRVEPPNIKVFVSSESKGNPYEPNELASLNTGLYCETVMNTRQQLLVPDAVNDEAWKSNPDIKLGMISYLGLPIVWPDGQIFGTICVLDNKRNAYSDLYLRLMLQWREVVQADLRWLAALRGQLSEREAEIRRLVDSNIIGIFTWTLEGQILEANEAFLRIVGYDREALVSGLVHWTDLTAPEYRDLDALGLAQLKNTGTVPAFEKEYLRKDGSRVPVLVGAASFGDSGDQGVAFVLDLTERKRGEAELRESERRYREVQMELAHANRLAIVGQLTASIAHEVKQPVAATIANATAGLRWLEGQAPNLDEVRQALTRIVKDANRSAEVIDRIRALIKRAPPRRDRLEINGAIREVIELTRGEALRNGVSVEVELANGLPFVQGDRVELQQVLLNLVVNAVEAMTGTSNGMRRLLINSGNAETGGVCVSVADSGPGLAPGAIDRLFEAFYTTKPNGLGLGLCICRSIVEAHGGQLRAIANVAGGTTFQFTVPAHPDTAL
jgi:PAS domain S-box-containing protein